MDEQLIDSLLNKPSEDTTVDFKSKIPRLDNDHFKAKFIKDILSLANTPREGSAYILWGVKARQDGQKTILGVVDPPDDADLQTLVASKVVPVPSFLFSPVKYKDVTLGVIEIEPRRPGIPYVSTWNKPDIQSLLKLGITYFRRGSSNSEAGPMDQERINKWMLGPDNIPISKTHSESLIEHWDEFFEATHRFDEGRLYILVLGSCAQIDHHLLSSLGRAPWSLILDFDTKTDSEGAYQATKTDLENRRALHLLTFDESVPFYPGRAAYWIAAKGLEGRPSTTQDCAGWQEWNRRNSRKLTDVVERFARSTAGSPVTVVVASDYPEETRIICQQLDSALGEAVQFVFTGTEESLSILATAFGTSSIPISLGNICSGLVRFLPTSNITIQEATLPTAAGVQKLIPTELLPWLEEELEVLHSAVAMHEPDLDRASGRTFLRGSTASWFDINMGHDVDRDKVTRLSDQLRKDLRDRTPRTVNLRHWPGAGGTTLARRVSWDLHRTYPVVRLRVGGSQHTIGRLRSIFDLTGLPVLVLVEAADVSAGTIEQLQTGASANHLPLIFLNIQRDFGSASEEERIVQLGRTLSNREAYYFTERLSQEVPERRTRLQQLAEEGKAYERTPFYVALVAFDKEFVSLENYVEYRLRTLATEVQKRILAYLALAYHYAQKPLSEHYFAELLDLSSNRTFDLEKVMPRSVVGDLITRDGPNRWRPIHDLVAEEIIRQVLAGTETDLRVWTQNLSSWSKELARFLAERPGIPTDDAMDLLRRMFVIRDDQQILGTEQSGQPTYSRLVEDIPNEEGRLTLFQELVTLFPDEAHFWAHLGRFYSFTLKDHDRAIQALRRALELTPQDNVVHHMLGMSIRAKAYSIIDTYTRQGGNLNELTSQLEGLEQEAGEEFQRSRELAPRDEHGYISHIQLMIRCVEAGFSASKARNYEEFLLSAGATWYRDLVDASETLLEELARLKIGQENFGRYFVQCRTGLDGLYGEYARVIERWNNLLGRQGVYQPPVRRQIVRAYLSRREREWHRIPEQELRRIIDLLEANILDEPKRTSNLRLWFQGVRNSGFHSIDEVIERLTYWWADSSALDAGFYLGVVHVLKALDGSGLSAQKAKELIEQTSRMVREAPNRHFSSEWLGRGEGLRRIVPYRLLGDWEEEFEKGRTLTLIRGQVASIRGPEQGWIELDCGLRAFFVPGRAYQGDTFVADRDENKRVEFYLAFSYDGLRAWSVRRSTQQTVT